MLPVDILGMASSYRPFVWHVHANIHTDLGERGDIFVSRFLIIFETAQHQGSSMTPIVRVFM